MNFSITSGDPSAEELQALKTALANHKMQVLKPVIKRSIFGLPQLRKPLPHQITFGARRESK
jgi:uncharacterized protein YukJ|tara:strand:- start:150 stop:335 length:186 start_codon:yes stop_codon:yes gene_type:complete